MDNLYNISSCPHVRSKLTTQGVMTDVLIALLPTAILGVVFHGFQAFLVIALSMCSAVVTEYLFNVVTKRKQTIYDRSAMGNPSIYFGGCVYPPEDRYSETAAEDVANFVTCANR